MKLLNIIFSTSALLALSACGGGSSSSDDSDDTNSQTSVKTGVFLDSPIINIGYRTETMSGLTNTNGEYKYLTGETVTFLMGNLEFPAVAANGTVTPLDIAATSDINDPKVINMIRLLQTLDKDGNPENGITITEATKSSATQVDFSLAVEQFASSEAVTALVTNADLDTPVTELIPTEEAIAHFQSQLGIAFTQDFINDRKFIVDSTSSDIAYFKFSKGGSGSIHFSANIDNDFDSEDTKDITWSINSKGALTFRETSKDGGSDYWDWVLTPIALTDTTASVSIAINGVEDGKNVSDSFTINISAPPRSISLVGTWVVTESVGPDVCEGGFKITYSNTTFTFTNDQYEYTQRFEGDIQFGSPCDFISNNDPDEIVSFSADELLTEADLEAAFNDSEIQNIDFFSNDKFIIEILFSNTELLQVWTRQ